MNILRPISVAAGLVGVALGAVIVVAVLWASIVSGSGAGMVAMGLAVLATPLVAALTAFGFIGLLITTRFSA